MSDASLEALLQELSASPIDDRAYSALIQILRGFDGSRLRISRTAVDAFERERFAAQLLKAGHQRAEVKARVLNRFGVAPRTANRDIGRALRPKSGQEWPERGRPG